VKRGLAGQVGQPLGRGDDPLWSNAQCTVQLALERADHQGARQGQAILTQTGVTSLHPHGEATYSPVAVSDWYSGKCSSTCRTHRSMTFELVVFGMVRILPPLASFRLRSVDPRTAAPISPASALTAGALDTAGVADPELGYEAYFPS
jgi:hypothetical protein